MTRTARRAHMQRRLENAHNIRRVPLKERAKRFFYEMFAVMADAYKDLEPLRDKPLLGFVPRGGEPLPIRYGVRQ